jgi:hypothetical protein
LAVHDPEEERPFLAKEQLKQSAARTAELDPKEDRLSLAKEQQQQSVARTAEQSISAQTKAMADQVGSAQKELDATQGGVNHEVLARSPQLESGSLKMAGGNVSMEELGVVDGESLACAAAPLGRAAGARDGFICVSLSEGGSVSAPV